MKKRFLCAAFAVLLLCLPLSGCVLAPAISAAAAAGGSAFFSSAFGGGGGSSFFSSFGGGGSSFFSSFGGGGSGFFSSGGGTFELTKPIHLKNLSTEPVEYTFAVESANDAKPTLPVESISLEPGAEESLELSFSAEGLASGSYEVFFKITSQATSAETRIPYWYAVQGSAAGAVVMLRLDPTSPRAGESVRIWFRVHDKAGLLLSEPKPVVIPILGGGEVMSLSSATETYPGGWELIFRAGPVPGPNVLTIYVGEETFTIQLTAGS